MKLLLKLTAMRNYKIVTLLLLFTSAPCLLMAQSVEKNSLSLNLKYYNDNNITHHLLVQAKSKINGKFQFIPNIPVTFYINSDVTKENLLGKGVTNEKGEAILEIPPAAKTSWVKSTNQNFVVISNTTKQYEESRGDLAITKAKLKLDTLEGKIITGKLVAFVDDQWKPIAGVDVMVGINRLGGFLNVSETQSYTTDSTSGDFSAEFKRDSIPGDQKGDIVLVATVVDNDIYGNLSTEMTVPWGKKMIYTTNYDHRSLFARRGHSPIWLEVLAYTIVVAVWLVIIYLLVQIKRLKKLEFD
jgi:hypothetical protein